MGNSNLTLALFEGKEPSKSKVVFVSQNQQLIDLVVDRIPRELRKGKEPETRKSEANT